MISHANSLANDGLVLIMDKQQKQQSISYGIDSIEPKRQDLEVIKQKLIEQIEEKRHNLKLLRVYIDKLSSINDWCTRGKDILGTYPLHISDDKAQQALTELEHFLIDFLSINLEDLQKTSAPEPLHSMIVQVFDRVNNVRDLCEKRCEYLRQFAKPLGRSVHTSDNPAIGSHDASIDKKLRHVVMELLVTEQVYVGELRTVIEGYMAKLDDPEHYRYLPPVILQNKSVLFSNLPEIYAFHARSFLPDLQQIYGELLSDNSCSIGSAIASCFIQRKSNFKFYEQYVLNKSQSESLWEQYCSNHSFFKKIQFSLGHRLPLDSYLLKPIQRITQYQLLLKEMIKYTRHTQERLHLQEALSVMLDIVSYLNDVMHSTQIIGYPDHLSSLGQIRLRSENCLISKEKHRGTVYTRPKTSTRDIFLFERVLLLCKKKDEGIGKSIQYQLKEIIQIVDIAVCTHPKNDRKRLEIVMKNYSYILQFTSNPETVEEISLRWIDTIKTSLTQQTDQRRAQIKHRSSSLDHSSHAHRRRSQKSATRAPPESDDEKVHLPLLPSTINHVKPNKHSSINISVSHL